MTRLVVPSDFHSDRLQKVSLRYKVGYDSGAEVDGLYIVALRSQGSDPYRCVSDFTAR